MNEKMTENRETENKVTNEQLLEHIAKLEEAMSLMTNSIALVFSIMLRNKDKFDFDESVVKHGRLAMVMETHSLTEMYTEVSKMKSKQETTEEEISEEMTDDLINMLTNIFS